MTSRTPGRAKVVGSDIAYPVKNIPGKLAGYPAARDITDADGALICACAWLSIAVAITRLLNTHRPNEWKGGV